MRKIILILFAFTALISCTNAQKEKTITIKDKYSVTIPSFLSEANDLNDDASFQFMNGSKELYIVVIEDSISDFQQVLNENDLDNAYKNDLNGFADLLFESMQTNLNPSNISPVKEVEINGMPALIYTFNAMIDGFEVYYEIAYIQGKKDYYQILTWTLASKQKDFKEVMNKMTTSFTEIK